jgi:hypothetical protein
VKRLLQILILILGGLGIAACGDNGDHVSITLFEAAPDAIEVGGSTRLLFAVDPPSAKVTIESVGDVTGRTETSVSPSATTTYQLTAQSGDATAQQTVTVTVGPRSGTELRVEPATQTPTAGEPVAVTLSVRAGDGNAAVGYRGTIHLTSSDGAAVLPGDVALTAADAGTKQVMVTFKTAGLGTVNATDTGRVGLQGSATLTVRHAAASVYELAPLPATAEAGQPLSLAITAKDAFGNLASSHGGQVTLTSTDPTDVLPGPGGFTNGVRIASIAFTKVGTHFATVTDASGGITSVDTTSVTVGHAPPFRLEVTPVNAFTIAGAAEAFTVKVTDRHGNTANGYRGTVHFTSDDLNASLPADYTFTAADAGVHTFSVTLKTSGVETVTVSDTTVLPLVGAATWRVSSAPATSCTIIQAPATAFAGAVVGLTVALHDAFGNVATSYAGTVRLTATDARATLPADVTYVPLVDNGRHVFSTSLFTAGGHTVTATDIANATLQCTAAITITPAAPILVVSMPGHANAGYPVTVGVTVKDVFDNPITSFAGTVSFTSSDTAAGAVTPAPITFTGTEGGIGSTSSTFMTLGNQIVTATGGGAANGSAFSVVHGLVYTQPTTGRVRLVVNAAASNTQIVQLDLIAIERLERSGYFSGGPGAFTVGMNLPLDTTRVTGDATLFTPAATLPASTGTRAAAAKLGSDNVLYTVVSRKREAGTNFTQSTEVLANQAFYSVRLKLQPNGTVGPVFDGAQPSPLFRAAVRDQFGDDFVNQGDFGLGKLEVR